MLNQITILPLAAASSTDIWQWAGSTMNDVYQKFVGLSTIAAALAIAICVLWRIFSANPRSVEICNSWIKRVVISWLVINVLGLIVNYAQEKVGKGSYTYKYSSSTTAAVKNSAVPSVNAFNSMVTKVRV